MIAENWGLADGIHVPKEKDSRKIDHFRPISLLNVEGKIFFSFIAKRMMRFVINNASIQKAGVPGSPGCIEHTTMLWDRIKTMKNNKTTELHVIWLDLENAYGSVRHQLLEKAMKFFWIPEDIKKLISTYFKPTYERFSNNKYSTNWQKLNIGIMMACVISPLLFVLVMEMILRSAEGCYENKAFKVPKLLKGNCKEIKFSVDRNEIPMIHEKSVKSLGRCYSLPLTDRHLWQDLRKQLQVGLRSIDKCDLMNKDKIWCIYFG